MSPVVACSKDIPEIGNGRMEWAELLKVLNQVRAELIKEGATNLQLDLDAGHNSISAQVLYCRPENWEEQEKRLETERNKRETKQLEKEQRREQYLKLKKEFEPDGR